MNAQSITTIHTLLPEEELIQRAVKILLDTLGPVETTRFLTLPHPQQTDSVLRHQQWQAMLNQEQFFDQIFGVQQEN